MKTLSLKTLNQRNLIEIIISLLSVFIGIILIYQSIYFIYAYNSGTVLFLFMSPMTNLISELMIGLFLTFSGFYLMTNNKKQTFFYKFTGILIMIFPLNEFLLLLIGNKVFAESLLLFIFFCGLFLYIFIRQKKYTIHEENCHYLKQDIVKTVIAIAAFLLIDVSFYSWNYFD